MSSDGDSSSSDDSSPYKYRLRTEKAFLAKEKVSDLLPDFCAFINRINTGVGLLRSRATLGGLMFSSTRLVCPIGTSFVRLCWIPLRRSNITSGEATTFSSPEATPWHERAVVSPRTFHYMLAQGRALSRTQEEDVVIHLSAQGRALSRTREEDVVQAVTRALSRTREEDVVQAVTRALSRTREEDVVQAVAPAQPVTRALSRTREEDVVQAVTHALSRTREEDVVQAVAPAEAQAQDEDEAPTPMLLLIPKMIKSSSAKMKHEDIALFTLDPFNTLENFNPLFIYLSAQGRALSRTQEEDVVIHLSAQGRALSRTREEDVVQAVTRALSRTREEDVVQAVAPAQPVTRALSRTREEDVIRAVTHALSRTREEDVVQAVAPAEAQAQDEDEAPTPMLLLIPKMIKSSSAKMKHEDSDTLLARYYLTSQLALFTLDPFNTLENFNPLFIYLSAQGRALSRTQEEDVVIHLSAQGRALSRTREEDVVQAVTRALSRTREEDVVQAVAPAQPVTRALSRTREEDVVQAMTHALSRTREEDVVQAVAPAEAHAQDEDEAPTPMLLLIPKMIKSSSAKMKHEDSDTLLARYYITSQRI
ncbi:hypothetical protein ISN45_Aa01g029830 [Arabidopsis thaliana x Arabidopsis arenosa]|uniref:Uncharacterized protein n=1 Tax=Arabidopsis thaliana x Arabidopsis arenosa TaxID=1240361 RepID=A0A8T2C4J9_9BRAS|nr:hypothetical protein ISN45_Aa01g029830 [Arabidopsis thaliana x Arabidopsis arenosa]